MNNTTNKSLTPINANNSEAPIRKSFINDNFDKLESIIGIKNTNTEDHRLR